MSTISERVDANAASLAAISTKLDAIISSPPEDHADLKEQLIKIRKELGDTSVEVTDTAVKAAASQPETIKPKQ